ncbi:MAG: hypothetical protein V2J26_08805 [Pacificimonas sp.]|jgi:hypothetical protein|nr:hypothetical protein [Pacificimonas sp.]
MTYLAQLVTLILLFTAFGWTAAILVAARGRFVREFELEDAVGAATATAASVRSSLRLRAPAA